MGGSSSNESNSPETAGEKEHSEESAGAVPTLEPVPPIDTIPMDERRRWLIKIVMLMRVDMRELFGMEVANRWGFWVDRYLSKQVRDFADWIQYPKGDHVLKGYEDSVWAAVISDDGYFLFTGDMDGMIKVWSLLDNRMIRVWEAHDSEVNTLAFQSGLLVSGSWDESIKIWDTWHDYQLVHTLKGHSDVVMSVHINEKATEVVSGAHDKSIRIWSVKTGECIRVLMGHSQRVNSLLLIGEAILSGSWDKSLKVCNPFDGTEIRTLEGVCAVDNLSINCDASVVVCATYDGFILHTWPELKYIRKVASLPYRCAFHPFHPHILAVSECSNLSVIIHDLTNNDVIHTLKGHCGYIKDICFTPDGTRLVSVSLDKSVRIWDVSDL